jgi:hypothetical protein
MIALPELWLEEVVAMSNSAGFGKTELFSF